MANCATNIHAGHPKPLLPPSQLRRCQYNYLRSWEVKGKEWEGNWACNYALMLQQGSRWHHSLHKLLFMHGIPLCLLPNQSFKKILCWVCEVPWPVSNVYSLPHTTPCRDVASKRISRWPMGSRQGFPRQWCSQYVWTEGHREKSASFCRLEAGCSDGPVAQAESDNQLPASASPPVIRPTAYRHPPRHQGRFAA